MLTNPLRQALYCFLIVEFTAGCSSSSPEPGVSTVDLRFSDAAVDGATEVVITVDKITFRQTGDGGDIVVDQFNGESMNDQIEPGGQIDSEVDEFAEQETVANADTIITGTDTYTIDLLTVQGNDNRLVLDDVQLPVGDYSNMLLHVVDEGIENSYVTDATGIKPLKVPSQTLKLGGFTITPNSKQSMVVEFGLQQSMTYNPGPDRYILKPRGVRIVSVDEASMISGSINHNALYALPALEPCVALDTGGTSGNLYLYEGHSLEESKLADNFDPNLLADQTDLIAPIASSSLQSSDYTLSYLEPGKYTLAISCNTKSDGADSLENLVIPNPSDQETEISLVEGDSLGCAIPLIQNTCSAN